jgi:carboxymethylenebutenolidase
MSFYRVGVMCFEFDAHPPAPPRDLLRPPIAGGAGAELLELTSADGTRFSAAIAESSEGRGGIVILPDVRGLYPFYTELAERFAQTGYHAIVLDYFGRTAGLGPRDEEFEYMPHVQQLKIAAVQDDLRASAAALADRTGASSPATVGFCLGGFQSFMAAADVTGLSAAVGFYGILSDRFGVPGPIDRAGDMRRPVLGLFGGADQAIPVEDVEQFDQGLTDAGVEHEIHVYPDAPHSFFDRRFEEHAEACADAWRRMVGFLDRHTAAA